MAFLSLTRPGSNGDRPIGATLTWRDLSVYVTAPSAKGNQPPFKRVLNNGIITQVYKDSYPFQRDSSNLVLTFKIQ